MSSRIRVSLLILVGLSAALILAGPAAARDSFWQGDTSTDWNTAANWYTVGAPSGGAYVPQSSTTYCRAIIGSDRPTDGAAMTVPSTGVFAPEYTSAVTGVKQTIGGLYLGLREVDWTQEGYPFLNPDPDAGALVGTLTISSGTLNNVTTANANIGADGRIMIGNEGRGFLTMTGGYLSGLSLEVAGEEYTGDALGTSMLDMSGSATININDGTFGTADFSRRLRIEGPNATISANHNVTFESSNDFTAVITSAPVAGGGTAMIHTGSIAKLGGTLNVEFSGAGATGHSLGDTWNLIDATTGLSSGNFTNLGYGGQITPSGLASDPPLGSAYFVEKYNSGSVHKVQLAYEGVLVLHVNRDSGDLTVANPLGGDIDIDAYTVRSALGSMDNSFDGITTDTGWESPGLNPDTGEPLNDTHRLTQWKQDGVYDVSGISPGGEGGISLGTGFNPQGVAADDANFGTDGEDLIFEYTAPNGGIRRGQIVYEGTKFENNLVLRVNPDTGEATLENHSLLTLHFDGYSVLSSTGALSGASWTGLGGDWDQSPASAGSLTETNLFGETVLAPEGVLSIGDISASALSEADQEGLSMQFILTEPIIPGAPVGDYNGDGIVDAGDYTVWRDNLGASMTLTNESPDATTPGVVDQEDFDFWKANFGSTGSNGPEAEFRVGAILFDANLGAGAGALMGTAAVPEPGTGVLLLTGLATLLWVRRGGQGTKRRQSTDPVATHGTFRQLGVHNMWRQCGFCLAVALGIGAVLFITTPARATTQGIALTNGDFELPGPVGNKTIAFDESGAPLDNIPGWTFPGPGVEDWGHTDHANGAALGDSGTEGGGNPGNEMILSTFDGVAYQTSSFNVVSVPSTQMYRLSFDAHNIYTILADGAPTYDDPQSQLTARLYYLNGATRTTIGSPLVVPMDAFENYTIDVVGGSSALTPALGYPIGVEFDCTSYENNPEWITHSWVGVDNVLLQITGVLPGDLDGDGDVDLIDYGIVRDNQQQPNLYNCEGEMTGDGIVDLNDFRAFKSLYAAAGAGGGAGAAAGAAAVPEPSTLVLALMFVGAAVWTKRRRFNMASFRFLFMAVIGLAFLAAPASAELLYYEPFLTGSNPAVGEYATGVTIVGQNPTLPGTGDYGTQPTLLSGPWDRGASGSVDNDPHLQVKEGGMNYIGAPAEGGSAGNVADEAYLAAGRTGRRFSTGLDWNDETEGTYYISWVQNFGAINNATDDMGFKCFEVWRDSTGDIGDTNLLFDLGYDAYWGGVVGPPQQHAATAKLSVIQYGIIDGAPDNYMEDTGTHLIVAKFEFSLDAASDTLSIYLDPTNATEPELAGLVVTDLDMQVGALGWGQFGSDGQPAYNAIDEIRIATTFADVLPELPYPGDTDGDGDVDLDDYNNIVTHMNMQVSSALLGDVAKADGTQGTDGRVTIADFRLWKDNYPYTPAGAGAGALTSGAVPEPASWLLLGIAALCYGGLRRRQR